MKRLLTALILWSVATQAGLPPTASKGDGESTYKTTFNTNYDTIPVTRSGTTVTIGTIPASKGGTGLTSPGTSGNVLTSNGSAWVSSAPASGFTVANARLVKSSAQSIANNTTTTVTWATVGAAQTWDTDSAFNAATGFYTVPASKGGKYRVMGRVSWSTANTSGIRIGYIVINGSTISYFNAGAETPAAPGLASMVFADEFTIAAGGTISIQVYQNSGGALNVGGNGAESYITIRRVE